MVSEEQKTEVGKILFGMLAIAMAELGRRMEFPSWERADEKVRENYLKTVDIIIEALEPPVYVSKKDKEKAELTV